MPPTHDPLVRLLNEHGRPRCGFAIHNQKLAPAELLDDPRDSLVSILTPLRDMEFEIDEEGIWHPISYRQDSLGMMQEAIFHDPRSESVKIRLYLLRDLKRFSKTWSRNLDEQGFADKARELGGGKPPQE